MPRIVTQTPSGTRCSWLTGSWRATLSSKGYRFWVQMGLCERLGWHGMAKQIPESVTPNSPSLHAGVTQRRTTQMGRCHDAWLAGFLSGQRGFFLAVQACKM